MGSSGTQTGPTYPLISTKLNPPRLGRDLTPRPRLLTKLHHNLHRKLTLVCAPAGYGKTTLILSWLAETDLPFAWLSLDAGDDDLLVFLEYFVAAVRQVLPGACTDVDGLLHAAREPVDSLLIAALINDLAALPQRLVIVLDDYHLLGQQRVHDCLHALVEQLPLQIHLVLISRVEPPLPLHNLRARDTMGEIRAADLRFTPAEAEQFLRGALPVNLSAEELALLAKRTEGWIAGLRLASLSLQQQSDPSRFVRAFAGHADAFISDYLLHEVLARQSDDVRDFLLRTSILDRFCAPLCDYMLDGDTRPGGSRRAAQSLLEYVDGANLFLVSLDPARRWYRYHHLFQELLQTYLKEHADSADIAALHRRAATWLRAEGKIEEAVRHFLAAGDLPAAAATVEAQMETVLNAEQRLQVERWLSLLPQALIAARPGLLVAQTWVLHWSFRHADYLPLLERAEALIPAPRTQDGPEEPTAVDLPLLGQIDALRSRALFFANRFEESLASATRALARLPDSFPFARRIAAAHLMFSLQALGRGDEALAFADTVLRRLEQPNSFQAGILLGTASTLWMQGELARVQTATDRLLRMAEKGDLRLSLSWGHYRRGLLCFERNDLQHAVYHLQQVVERRYHTHLAAYREALACLTLTFEAQGAPADADGALAELRAFAQQLGTDRAYAVLHSIEARLQLKRGQLAAALASTALIDMQLPPEPMLSFDVPQFIVARVLIAEASAPSLDRAQALLEGQQAYARATHNVPLQIVVLALCALLHKARGEWHDALAKLANAILLARPGDFVRTFVDMGPAMAALLQQLALRGTEPAYVGRLLAAFPAHPGPGAAEGILPEPLTDQELRVLQLLQSRLTNKEIAKRLVISPNTVKRHTINLYRKLGVNDRHEAVSRAENSGLLPVGEQKASSSSAP